MKKRRKKALRGASEGPIKDIYRLFIRPFLYLKPDQVEYKDWLDNLFNVDSRIIKRAVAVEPFEIPGKYHVNASYTSTELGARRVNQNEVLWVRFDVGNPELVEVELNNGPANKSQWFDLDRDQWEFIKSKIKYYPLPSELEC